MAVDVGDDEILVVALDTLKEKEEEEERELDLFLWTHTHLLEGRKERC